MIGRTRLYPNDKKFKACEKEIINILKKYSFSISQARGLFCDIINILEDKALK